MISEIYRVENNFNKYLEKYQSLINRLPNLTFEIKLFEFIDGLPPIIQQHIYSHNPKSLDEAIEYARVAYVCG